MTHRAGRHFLQIPGPTNVPDRVLRAIDRATIDHRSQDFAELGRAVLAGLRSVFKTAGAGHRVPVLGHRRVGGGARQHAVARRPGADVRDRAFRDAVAQAWRRSSASRSSSSPATGATASIPPRSRRAWPPTRATRSRRSWSCTTRPRPASPAGSARSARRSTARAIRRSSWSTPSPRSPRSTTATTNGASTSPSPARRRG